MCYQRKKFVPQKYGLRCQHVNDANRVGLIWNCIGRRAASIEQIWREYSYATTKAIHPEHPVEYKSSFRW